MNLTRNLSLIGLFLSITVNPIQTQENSETNTGNRTEVLEEKLDQIDVSTYQNNLREYVKLESFNLFTKIVKTNLFAYNNTNTSFEGIIPEGHYYFTYNYSSNNGKDLTDIKLGMHYKNGNSLVLIESTKPNDPMTINLYEKDKIKETFNFYNSEVISSLEKRYLKHFIQAISKGKKQLTENKIQNNIHPLEFDEIGFTFVKNSHQYIKEYIDNNIQELIREGFSNPHNVTIILSKIKEGYYFINEIEIPSYGANDIKEVFQNYLEDKNITEIGAIKTAELLSKENYVPYYFSLSNENNLLLKLNLANNKEILFIYKDQYLRYGIASNKLSRSISPTFERIEDIIDYYSLEEQKVDPQFQGYTTYEVYAFEELNPFYIHSNDESNTNNINIITNKDQENSLISKLEVTKEIQNLPDGITIEYTDKYEIMIPKINIGNQIDILINDKTNKYIVQDGSLESLQQENKFIKQEQVIYFNNNLYQIFIVKKE